MRPIEHSVSSSEPLALLSRTPSIAMGFAVGALLMMCWTTPSPANVLYEYTGNTFDGFFGDPYYEGYFVSVSLTMASLLPPNLVEADIAPYVLDFSFNDGLQTMTKASASGGPFIASTDASGAITQWNLDTVRQQTCEICMPTFFYITNAQHRFRPGRGMPIWWITRTTMRIRRQQSGGLDDHCAGALDARALHLGDVDRRCSETTASSVDLDSSPARQRKISVSASGLTLPSLSRGARQSAVVFLGNLVHL